MGHRIGLTIVFGAAFAALGWIGNRIVPKFHETFRSLPGGEEGLPEITRNQLRFYDWISGWWWACILLSIGVFLVVPRVMQTDPEGQMRIAKLDKTLDKYGGAALALSAALIASFFAFLVMGMIMPLLAIVDQLTEGGR